MSVPEKKETTITKEKPVTKVIAEVREKMCTDYCKFPQIYTPDEWEEVAEEVCAGCPLDRL